jgi:dihydrodipicolinate synthase/N-acetylneuraminate lyase
VVVSHPFLKSLFHYLISFYIAFKFNSYVPAADQPKVGFPGFVKAVMKLKGMDVGPPRLPMLPLSPDDYKALELSLNEIGFFQWS